MKYVASYTLTVEREIEAMSLESAGIEAKGMIRELAGEPKLLSVYQARHIELTKRIAIA